MRFDDLVVKSTGIKSAINYIIKMRQKLSLDDIKKGLTMEALLKEMEQIVYSELN
jgi:ATP-dependent DNA helicase RecQ